MPWRHVGEVRYSSTHSLTLALDRGVWSVSCPSHFTHRERVPIPTGWEAAWAPEPVWTWCWREKFPAPAGISFCSSDHPIITICENLYFTEHCKAIPLNLLYFTRQPYCIMSIDVPLPPPPILLNQLIDFQEIGYGHHTIGVHTFL